MSTLLISQKDKKNAAFIAALALLIMTVFAGIAYGLIHSKLIIMSDSELTHANLMNEFTQFKFEIFSWLAILLLDIVVAVAFYYYFKSINKRLAVISASLRIIYSVFLGIGIYHLLKTAFNLGDNPLSGDIMNRLNLFDKFWSFGLIFFGLHLMVIAILMFQAYKVPRLLSLLMLFAGLCYFIVHTLYFIAPSLNSLTHSLENILAIPMAIGELSFALWLLIRGSRQSFLDAA